MKQVNVELRPCVPLQFTAVNRAVNAANPVSQVTTADVDTSPLIRGQDPASLVELAKVSSHAAKLVEELGLSADDLPEIEDISLSAGLPAHLMRVDKQLADIVGLPVILNEWAPDGRLGFA